MGRFINADDESVLGAGFNHAVQYNHYAYCWNNPVNMLDDEGTWPKWLKNVVKVAVGVAAIGTGAATSAISHRVSTGSWKGAGKAAFRGAVDGAVDGFMAGGIMAGGSQIVSAGFKVVANAGVKTGVKGGIKLTKNIKVLSPNSVKYFENGGTLIKFGKNIRVDIGAQTMLHTHLPGVLSTIKHFPIGTIGAGLYGGLEQWR